MASEKDEKSPNESSDDFSGTVFIPHEEESDADAAPLSSSVDNSRTYVNESELIDEENEEDGSNTADSQVIGQASAEIDDHDNSGTVFIPNENAAESAPPSSSVDNSRTYVNESELIDEEDGEDGSNTADSQVIEQASAEIDNHDNGGTVVLESQIFDDPDNIRTADSQLIEVGPAKAPSEDVNDRTFVMDSEIIDDPLNLRTVQSDTFGDPSSGRSPSDENDRTYVVDSHPDVRPGSQTVDSRTINMDVLDEQERKIWEQVSAKSQEQSRTRMSDVDDSVQVGGPAMESNLLLLSRRLHERSDKFEESGLHPDYEILRVLGRGGMGVVYEARQASLDRTVAIKVIQTIAPSDRERYRSTGRFGAAQKLKREQFLSEAVVTGDLDHPNIVPIYDVAKTHEGDLFYSMKRVEGTPWDKVIDSKSLDDNLDILLKVMDAVAFAHSRGVVHRDIKPENVMLGEFGAVMLMDWGLAVPTAEFRKLGTVRQVTSLGGSPAYMAPELAIGPISRIGRASDIYLLGAVLYQMISGHPPHSGKGVSQCLRAAVENIIDPVPAEKQGELYNIAMKSMAKQPSDRYQSVQEMQAAIRSYRSHTESINLSKRAAEDVERARETDEYGDYARAVFGYEQALELWEENSTARQGAIQARLAYAESACRKEDFDLGLSLLNENESEFQPMLAQLKHGQTERSLRRSRLAAFRRVAAGLLLIIFIGGGGMSWTIFQTNQQLTEAVGTIDKANQTIKAAKATVQTLESNVAVKQQELHAAQEKVVLAQKEAGAKIKQAQETADLKIAEAASQVEMVNSTLKLAQTKLNDTVAKVEVAQAAAIKAAADAARAEADAAYVNYASAISQARSYLDQNQHGQAYQILNSIREARAPDQPLAWEWQRLWYEANRARRHSSTAEVPVDGRHIRFSSSGQLALATYDDGALELVSIQPQGDHVSRRLALPVATVAAAFSPDERQIAAAGADGAIRLVDRQSGQIRGTLQRKDLYGASGPAIHVVQFLTGNLLLSGSQDSTIRMWDVTSGQEVGVCWNLASILDLDAVELPRGQGWLVAAAVSDLRNGRVVVWRIAPEAGQEQFTRVADLLAHGAPVLSVAFHPDGQTVASADQSGRILVWNWQQIGQLDYHDRISSAVAKLRTGQSTQPVATDPKVRELSDPALSHDLRRDTASGQSHLGHRDAVQKIRFSPDGRWLVSASNDLTLKVWNVETGRLAQTLRGQGGPVRSVDFSPARPRTLMSAGSGGLLSWDLATSNEVMVYREESTSAENQFTAHNDEILSASFDRTGTRIVTSSRDHTARVLEIDPVRQEIRQIADLRDEPAAEGAPHSPGALVEGGEFISLSMQTTADNSRLFVGGADGIIRIWNVPRAIEISSIVGTGLNTSFAISPNGQLVLTGSSQPDARALVWALNEQGHPERNPRWKLNGHQDTVTAFAISADGRRLFTGDRQGMGILWDAESGQQIGSTLRQHAGSRLNAAAFTGDGTELFIAGDNRSVSRVKVATREVLENLKHDGFVTDLSLAPNGRQLMTVTQIPGESETRTRLLLWNLAIGSGQSTSITVDEESNQRNASGDQPERKREIRSIRFAGNSLAYSTLVDTQQRRSFLKVWKILPEVGPELVRGVAFPAKLAAAEVALQGPPGQIFTLNGDAVFLWDLQTLGHLRSYRPHSAVTQASFSSDGRYVATSSRTVKIWDVTSQKTMAQMEFPHEGPVRSVAFSPVPGSYLLLTAGDDGKIKLWDWHPETATVEEVRNFAEGPRIQRVCFSEDGELILAVGEGGFAKVWRTDGQGTPLVLTDGENTSDALCGAISDDKKWVVVGSKDRVARLWRLADDQSSARLVRKFSGHADEISDIDFISSPNPANLRIVSASRDMLVRIWDPRIENLEEAVAPRELLVLRSHTLGVTAVDMTDDNRLLMSAGLDGDVILWPTVLNP
ncbi:protein kinase domain-containing protein [Planctomicrobium sp. SH661]|uniref:WD40 repeat domain-containing serine/threonine protein kinase n=1 Tax=Planctomicrobium sp. SH661 TaxID=3448124 RepID=UPI003F5C397B